MPPKPLLAVVCVAALAGCATATAPGGRPQLTAPASVSSLYSSVDMDLRLAAARPLTEKSPPDRSFDLEVARLGARLSRAAYDMDPKLRDRVPAFSFRVADKAEAGTASDSRGDIVVFRGVRRPGLDDRALAFLIAREMGHVIARHHEEKSATSLLLSMLVQLLMPLTNLTGGLAALTGSTASALGTEIVASRNGGEQTREADEVAFALMRREGWNSREVSAALSGYARSLGNEAGVQALKRSLETAARGRHGQAAGAKA